MLYEVITKIQGLDTASLAAHVAVTHEHGLPLHDAACGRDEDLHEFTEHCDAIVDLPDVRQRPVLIADIRITSYNVCYTKLLRRPVHYLPRPTHGRTPEVSKEARNRPGGQPVSDLSREAGLERKHA